MSNMPHSEATLPLSARKIATGTAGTPNMAACAQVTKAAVRDRYIEVPPFDRCLFCAGRSPGDAEALPGGCQELDRRETQRRTHPRNGSRPMPSRIIARPNAMTASA